MYFQLVETLKAERFQPQGVNLNVFNLHTPPLTADEENVCGVNLDEVSARVLPAALPVGAYPGKCVSPF